MGEEEVKALAILIAGGLMMQNLIAVEDGDHACETIETAINVHLGKVVSP